MNILLNANVDSPDTYEYPLFAIYFINGCALILWLWATVKMISRVYRVGKGFEVPLWIIIILLLPLVGAIIAHYRFNERA